MQVEAHAKINLTLEVYGRRADGYHTLRSLVQPIVLADTLEIDWSDDALIRTDTGYGEKDLIVRAALALRMAYPTATTSRGVNVRVTKRIPAGGGLGGGSADAAAVLCALNDLWGLGLSSAELAVVGATVGCDIPALVLAQQLRTPVWMEGRGECVRPAKPRQASGKPFLILAYPGVSSSTAEVFSRCVPRTEPTTVPVNDLQAAACALHPEIAMALAALVAAGASDVLMSGSGSVVYGFAADEPEAQAIAAQMRTHGCKAWVTSALGQAEESRVRL